MKILVISSYLPFPLYSGGNIRLYNILKRLSKHHEITLVCEKRAYQTEEDVRELEKICKKVITVPRKAQWSAENILKTGFSSSPFLLTGHNLPEMKKIIKYLLANEEFDLMHAETFYIAQNLSETSLPVVIAEHNIEYNVYERFSAKAKFFLKPFLKVDILKLKLAEERTWRSANAVIAVSNQDRNIIGKFNKNVYLVPNGVDLDKFKFKAESVGSNSEKTILFIGDFKWVQNRDAAEFILKKVWPSIDVKARLWVVGKNIPQNLKDIKVENVFFDENAPDDTSEIFKKAHILLAPIRVGGGTSYKIIEAMASGVPVVTTTLGAVGLGARDKEEIIIADSEEETVKELEGLLEDNDLYSKIAKGARKLVEEKYNWDGIVSELEGVYKKIL